MDKFQLPDTPILLFASPVLHDGDNHATRHALDVIGIYKSILVAFFGRGFLLDRISTFTVEGVAEGKTSFGSSVWRTPQDIDCRAIVDPRIYSDLVDRIPLQIDPLRSQIGLACQFFSSALEETQEYKRFFDYWTALEIIAQGKSQKIRSMLAHAYGSTAQFVEEQLGYKEISNLRHQLIHHGTFANLEPNVERRIQGVFLDLWRHRVGLPCARVTERLRA